MMLDQPLVDPEKGVMRGRVLAAEILKHPQGKPQLRWLHIKEAAVQLLEGELGGMVDSNLITV